MFSWPGTSSWRHLTSALEQTEIARTERQFAQRQSLNSGARLCFISCRPARSSIAITRFIWAVDSRADDRGALVLWPHQLSIGNRLKDLNLPQPTTTHLIGHNHRRQDLPRFDGTVKRHSKTKVSGWLIYRPRTVTSLQLPLHQISPFASYLFTSPPSPSLATLSQLLAD